MAALQNDIYIGSVAQPLYHYSNRSIEMGTPSGLFSVDIIGNELSIDTFSLTVRYNPDAINLIYAPKGKDGYKDSNGKIYRLSMNGRVSAKDYLQDIPYGTPVFWYVSNSFFTKGYLKSVERVGKYQFKLTCISGVGLLDTKYHVGGLYNGATVKSIFQSIVGSTFGWTMAADVAQTLVYGHLPYDTCRNNLHRLLFSCGASLTRGNATNDYVIKYITTGSPVVVPSSRIALGGSVSTQLPANSAEVTEYSYYGFASDTTETLFDNTNGQSAAVNNIVVFKEPMHDLACTGTLTIAESNCNYAIVNGTGVLTGQRYTRTEQIITYGSGNPPRTKKVSENHLVSFANSLNVAKRVLNYFASARTIKAKIMLQNENCGNNLSVQDVFGDQTTAFLERMTVLVTSVKGAQCDLVEGYVPGYYGNNYGRRAFISSDGTWTVPAGVTRIRLVLIGGGQGGQGGYSGEAGEGGSDLNITTVGSDPVSTTVWYSNQRVALGGSGGNGGSGGKVLIVDKDVTPGEEITFSVGAGGNGGTGGAGSSSKTSAAGSNGADGGDTTATSTSIGTVTSADGSSAYGYSDPITGETFAVAGDVGISGAQGGQTDTTSLSGSSGTSGLQGGNSSTNNGGAGGTGYTYGEPGGLVEIAASGGGGGGAAIGADGGTGGNAQRSGFHNYGGNGGTGANATAPAKAVYGNGGTGGNGGGAGGNGGGGYRVEYTPITESISAGSAGNGGNGSVGGEGGDGCAIIIY